MHVATDVYRTCDGSQCVNCTFETMRPDVFFTGDACENYQNVTCETVYAKVILDTAYATLATRALGAKLTKTTAYMPNVDTAFVRMQ